MKQPKGDNNKAAQQNQHHAPQNQHHTAPSATNISKTAPHQKQLKQVTGTAAKLQSPPNYQIRTNTFISSI